MQVCVCHLCLHACASVCLFVFACLFACVCVMYAFVCMCEWSALEVKEGERGWLMRLGTCGPLDLCDVCLASPSFAPKESAKLEMFKSVLFFFCTQRPGLVSHQVQGSVEGAYWTGTLCLTWAVLIWPLVVPNPLLYFFSQMFFYPLQDIVLLNYSNEGLPQNLT